MERPGPRRIPRPRLIAAEIEPHASRDRRDDTQGLVINECLQHVSRIACRDCEKCFAHRSFIAAAEDLIAGCLDRNVVLQDIVEPDAVAVVIARAAPEALGHEFFAVEHIVHTGKRPRRVRAQALGHAFPDGRSKPPFGQVIPRHRDRDRAQADNAGEPNHGKFAKERPQPFRLAGDVSRPAPGRRARCRRPGAACCHEPEQSKGKSPPGARAARHRALRSRVAPDRGSTSVSRM